MKHTRSCTLCARRPFLMAKNSAPAAAQPRVAKSRTAQGAQPVAGRRGRPRQRGRVHRRVLMRTIDRSMAVGFTRLGADLMVVPEGALTNITAALLVVEPTDLALDADRWLRPSSPAWAARGAEGRADRAFGRRQPTRLGRPDRLRSRARLHRPAVARRELNRPPQRRRHPGGRPRWGAGHAVPDLRQAAHRLRPARRTGVGTHERGVFMSFATLAELAEIMPARAPAAVLAPGKVTGFLVELAPGATAQQARFASCRA